MQSALRGALCVYPAADKSIIELSVTDAGIGIAKKTVDLLRSEIIATSEVGVGTTFTVRLAAS